MSIMTILKFILGMKFGWVILSIVGLLLGFSLLKNILSGSFSLVKFASGFNVFSGGVQGKLIYYGIMAILGYGLFHQLTKATTEYNTDYRNNIHHNRDVAVDQRIGEGGCAVNIGWGLIKLGCKQEPMKTNAEKIVEQKPKVEPKTNIVPRGKK